MNFRIPFLNLTLGRLLVHLSLLEPVMHFEEVIDYRVGQAVLHSTQ